MRTLKILGVGVALLAISGPALATHGGKHPTFRTEQTYLHCSGTTKLANVSLLEDQLPTWDTNPPAKSASEGGGCGYAVPGTHRGAYMKNIYDAAFSGTFTGNLDTLTVQLHNIYVGGARSGSELTVLVRLTVDGDSVFGMQEITLSTGEKATVPATRELQLKPVASSTGASGLVEFSIVNLGYGTEDGDGKVERDLQLTIDTREPVNGWVYDAKEVPSGILFNPATLSSKVVTAVGRTQ